jgi:hypothetical protein
MRSQNPQTSIFIKKTPLFSRLLRIKSLTQRKYVVSEVKNRDIFLEKILYYNLMRMVYVKTKNSLSITLANRGFVVFKWLLTESLTLVRSQNSPTSQIINKKARANGLSKLLI